MTGGLPLEVERILEAGSFCHLAAITSRGPHLTPTVFALSGGRLWVTTSRGSVKGRAWHRDPRVGGLVRSEGLAVSFTGTVRTYDALDPDTWGASLVGAPALGAAAARFTRKNARFFAGYAVDAKDVPFAWTPPGRVFARIELERTAVLDERGVVDEWGSWEHGVVSHTSFRASRKGDDPLGDLPSEVREPLGRRGGGTLALADSRGPAVLPVGWAVEEAELYAVLPAESLGLADLEKPDAPVALVVDKASSWRAKQMVGVMVQGDGAFFAIDRLGSGKRSAEARAKAAEVEPSGAALVRIRPRRLVWWRGWSSGTVVTA